MGFRRGLLPGDRYGPPVKRDPSLTARDRRKGYTNLAACLACYAMNTYVAMGCRESGDVTGASIYEHAAQLSYDRLPEDLRW